MSTRYKRTNWVRRLEDFSSGCSSGLKLGQCLIAGILAIFSGISRLLPVTRWLSVTLSPDVPVVSTVGGSKCSKLRCNPPFFNSTIAVGLASRNEVSFHPTLAKIALIGSLSCLMTFLVSPNLTACQLYGVHDQGLNNTQFFTVSPETFEVKALGEMKKAHDIEALDIHPQTAELFAASGKDTQKPGYLYRVDKNTGQLIDIGSTGFKEIDGLSFHPDGTLWGWASGDGLVTIDSTTGKTRLVATHSGEVEDLTWNTAGTMLFGVENLRNNPDAGVKLLAYDGNTVTTVCEELTQSLEIEALDTLPDDTLIFGLHGKNGLPLGVVNVETCQIVAETEIATDYNDVEGIAWPNCQNSDEVSPKVRKIAVVSRKENFSSGHSFIDILEKDFEYVSAKKDEWATMKTTLPFKDRMVVDLGLLTYTQQNDQVEEKQAHKNDTHMWLGSWATDAGYINLDFKDEGGNIVHHFEFQKSSGGYNNGYLSFDNQKHTASLARYQIAIFGYFVIEEGKLKYLGEYVYHTNAKRDGLESNEWDMSAFENIKEVEISIGAIATYDKASIALYIEY